MLQIILDHKAKYEFGQVSGIPTGATRSKGRTVQLPLETFQESIRSSSKDRVQAHRSNDFIPDDDSVTSLSD